MRLLNIVLIIYVLYYIYNSLYTFTEYYYKSDPFLSELHRTLSVLHPKLKTVQIFEGDQSYTLNKKKIYICLRDKNGDYYGRNMLTYVLCHEYAHVLCDKIDEHTHSKEFFEIFDDLIYKATQMGLYNPSIPPIDNYCMK